MHALCLQYSIFASMNPTLEMLEQIINLLVGGMSMRAVFRVAEVSINSIIEFNPFDRVDIAKLPPPAQRESNFEPAPYT